MKRSLPILALAALAACAPDPIAFRPVPVDIPVTQACTAPPIAKPPDALANLQANAKLTDAMRACLQQTLADKAYETQMQAVQNACR